MSTSNDSLLWPFAKIEHNLVQLEAQHATAATAEGDDQQPKQRLPPLCVLLTTGALNPVHKGHVSMHHKAAAELSAKYGIHTLGTFLSPSNDLYLAGKYGKGRYIPGTVRTACVDAATENDTLISTGRWETAQTGHWPDFPEVAQDLQQTINKQFSGRHSIMVLYVCGADHYKRCGLSRGMRSGIGLCVIARDGAGGVTNKERNIFAVNTEDETSDFSSTKVRKVMKTLLASGGGMGNSKDSLDEVESAFSSELEAFIPEGVAQVLVKNAPRFNVSSLA